MLVRLQVVSSTAAGWRVGGQAGWQAVGWVDERVGGSVGSFQERVGVGVG